MNIWKRATIEQVNELIEDPVWESFLSSVITKLNTRFFQQSDVDIIFQKFARFRKIDVYDAYDFARIWLGIGAGEIVTGHLKVGVSAFADAEHEKINATLQKVFNEHDMKFTGVFWGGKQDSDGYIEWHKPIELWSAKTQSTITIAPGQAPLEVGYTDTATSFGHLCSEGFLARWPYGREDIVLLHRLDTQYSDAQPLISL
ncbi:MAG: hypothetical protein IPO91_03190 [Chloroflexi bacterium]|nr:hypothetical protein [Chloroflexota bacterium]